VKPVALVIDDEVQIRRLLRVVLESADYQVHEAETAAQGLTDAATRRPDVVLLDLGLPDSDGVNVLRRLREWSQVPVIVLSVRDDEEGKVAALDAGADDYVTKPFSSAELLARLRAAQRKTRPEEEISRFKSGDLIVDLTARVVTRAGHEVKLTATPAASSPTARSCAKSGVRSRKNTGNISAFMSRTSVRKSNATPPLRN
jgi:two-component system KDP operon response regulator KdpE